MRALPLLLLANSLTACELAPPAGADTRSALTAPLPARYVSTSVGRVDSAAEARQLIASSDGVIARLFVARGQRVSAGQSLLWVECDQREAAAKAQKAEADRQYAAMRTVLDGARAQEIAAARNVVQGAEALQDDASDRMAQAEALAVDGFVSRRELEARRNALAVARADVGAARARRSLIETGPRGSERRAAVAASRAAQGQAEASKASARQCALKSPIDGEVLQILRREGEFSGASQGIPLIVVGDMSKLVVRAEINERDAARIARGQGADVWIEGQKTRWQGQIVSLARIMGRRSARSLDPTDRFDRDVREVFVGFDGPAPPAIVGLRVMVGVKS